MGCVECFNVEKPSSDSSPAFRTCPKIKLYLGLVTLLELPHKWIRSGITLPLRSHLNLIGSKSLSYQKPRHRQRGQQIVNDTLTNQPPGSQDIEKGRLGGSNLLLLKTSWHLIFKSVKVYCFLSVLIYQSICSQRYNSPFCHFSSTPLQRVRFYLASQESPKKDISSLKR